MKMSRMFLKLSRLALAAIICLAFSSIPAEAQSGGGYQFSSSVVAGGGVDSSGGSYTLAGTSGQAAAGGPSENVPFYLLLAGFWATSSDGYSINGQITYNGAGLAEVTVTLERDGVTVAATKTDSNGNYSFAKLEGGHNYNVTPSKDSYAFAPFNATLLNLSGNMTANFSVVARNFSLKGKVTSGGAGLDGVTVTLKFQNGNVITSVKTNESGDYSFIVTDGASYTVEAQKAGYSLAPQNYVYQNLSADQTANFVATPITYSINGQVTENGAGLGEVVMSLTVAGGATSTTKTDAAGFYAFSSLASGADYTLTPSKGGYTFNPSSQTFTKLGGNQTANFTGTGPAPLTSSIEFEQASYSVNEGEHYQQIMVTRSGDVSATASVSYATQDSTAQQHSDYIIALGSLQFAPGETRKTLTLLVTEDSYVEGSETFSLVLSDARGAVLGAQSVSQITITDNDSDQNAPNAINDVGNFVRQHYHDFLNREPDPEGFKGWQESLNNCKAGDTSCDRIEVSSGFFRSSEFQERGYFIYRFYSVALGRKPDYAEFMPDLAKVSGFLTEAEKEANKTAFVNEFMARSVFKSKYDALTAPAGYVDALLQTAGLPNHPSRATWIDGLDKGTLTRAQVLRALAESAEVYSKFYNEAFVVMQYFGYLRRDPDILYLDWIKIMNENGGDYRGMIDGFMNSLEYRQRFGQ